MEIGKKIEKAVQKFSEGYNCAQSVFYAFSDGLQVNKDTTLRLACGFGAGMARKQEVCGAVTGGIIVLGAKHGRGENEDREVTERLYQKTQYLMDQFEAKHGTVICRRLLNGCDLTTDDGQKFFKENELLNKTCKPCVQTVVELLEKILV